MRYLVLLFLGLGACAPGLDQPHEGGGAAGSVAVSALPLGACNAQNSEPSERIQDLAWAMDFAFSEQGSGTCRYLRFYRKSGDTFAPASINTYRPDLGGYWAVENSCKPSGLAAVNALAAQLSCHQIRVVHQNGQIINRDNRQYRVRGY